MSGESCEFADQARRVLSKARTGRTVEIDHSILPLILELARLGLMHMGATYCPQEDIRREAEDDRNHLSTKLACQFGSELVMQRVLMCAAVEINAVFDEFTMAAEEGGGG